MRGDRRAWQVVDLDALRRMRALQVGMPWYREGSADPLCSLHREGDGVCAYNGEIGETLRSTERIGGLQLALYFVQFGRCTPTRRLSGNTTKDERVGHLLMRQTGRRHGG